MSSLRTWAWVGACVLVASGGACRRIHVVTVNADGTFTPPELDIKAGDRVVWTGLGRTDAIVRIGDPAAFPATDPCGLTGDELDRRFDGADLNDFTGPARKGESGIFALGPDGPGFAEIPAAETCACELDEDPPCVPAEVLSLDGQSYKLCPGQGGLHQTMESTWSNPDVAGVIVRMGWSDLQIDDGGVIRYRFDDLDREMNAAVAHGKLFALDIKAGKGGTPDWIFTDYAGPAPAGPVAPLLFKDWGSEGTPPEHSCGFTMKLGSPTDTAYRDLYTAMIRAVADHIAGDSRWFQALGRVKVSGANFLSSEARLPKRCYDGDLDGELDVVRKANGRPDNCRCNTKTWADAHYTPAGLATYFRVVENTIFDAFWQRKSMGYQLIQAGFPKVESPTNFEGDSLRDQDGVDLLTPPGTAADDLDGTVQTETNLDEGRNGRFVDPLGVLGDAEAGKLFVPQHSGIGRLPEDDGLLACSQAQTVDMMTLKAAFPIPAGTRGDPDEGCPTKWAVNEATLHDQLTGFQTNNDKEVATAADVESALWNLTINTNAVFVELYEERLWEIRHTRGMGGGAAVLDAGRALMGGPAPYSKNLDAWGSELHERRRVLVDETNPHLADPFPTVYDHVFGKPIVAPETYHYINPTTCSLSGAWGRITVSP